MLTKVFRFFSSTLAAKHRLCCCAGLNSYKDAFICLKDETQKVVDNGGGRYKMSTKGWAFDSGAPVAGDLAWVSFVLCIVLSLFIVVVSAGRELIDITDVCFG